MSNCPPDLRYTKEHEWAKLQDDGAVLVGITFFAQEELGDVVYLGLPAIGSKLLQSGKMGEIESVKAVSDLFSPVSGDVVAVNTEAMDHPELVNEDPYGKAWLVKVRPSRAHEMDALLTAEQYEAYVATQAKEH
ncbi:MAG: glycine cleavage system protein GcvH [Dehalococcoidia bacterium]|nr:glycine cleavage system protein GcvH [Dehalococcoidia bacterium]